MNQPLGHHHLRGANMADAFADRQPGLESPPAFAAAVTPSDSTDLTTDARSLYIGGSGNVKVTTSGGSTETFYNLSAGSYLVQRVHRVWSTGTTATYIVAVW
ncbi:spike base protein, RCAP_Rcc01079 family [Prosthecomicrobium hirschii]|uniref:spike base protein, RCAP_Rcc01079 family n=1 Tax=Prosthecodimorpha hirschii TaxID=665126 RepID=UPI00128F27E0|nr:hypothetical protein [Prosthecomicrobium hirschii]